MSSMHFTDFCWLVNFFCSEFGLCVLGFFLFVFCWFAFPEVKCFCNSYQLFKCNSTHDTCNYHPDFQHSSKCIPEDKPYNSKLH